MVKTATFHSVRRILLTTVVLTGGLYIASARAPANDESHDVTPQYERRTVRTMTDDLAQRASDIHWPEGFSPMEAEIFSHNEGVINAPCERVWTQLVEAVKWPEWYPNGKSVQIRGGGHALEENSVFTWTTFGLPIESKVDEFDPVTRIGWFGSTRGGLPTFYHAWLLTPTDNRCQVISEEVGYGANARRLRESDEGLMHRGYDLWIAALRWVAESR